jgi:hypothetical protein
LKSALTILFSITFTCLISQNDSILPKPKFGTSVSICNFIDYSIIKTEPFNKNAYYQGFDIGLFVRDHWDKFQFQIGVSGGNAYPLFDNLNYYMDLHYLVWSKTKKYMLDIDEKILFSYSSKPNGYNSSIVRRAFYSQTGINFFMCFNKFEYGIGYCYWIGDYKLYYKGALSNTNPYDDKPLREEVGFIPIGILNITARYRFN